MNCAFRIVLAVALLFPGANAYAGASASGQIYITTGLFGSTGLLLSMDRTAPFGVTTVATLGSSDSRVQVIGTEIYVIEPQTDLVRVFSASGAEVRSFSVGVGTSPRDIIAFADRAYVTRANSTFLYRVNPLTGVGADLIDLSMFADADGIPDMERMIIHGDRLFVQLRRVDINGQGANGALAVIDLATETLIDAVPATPEIDAIELLGPAPRLRMHIDAQGQTLLVSATDGNQLSLNGGIERINLQTLASQGFTVAEIDVAALGGFVVTNIDDGYMLFHTDIIASNHLVPFTLPGGAVFGPEIVFDAGLYLDALLYDPATQLLFMPGTVGFGATDGLLSIVDTQSNTQLGASPITLPGIVVDQVMGPGLDADANGDCAVNLTDLSIVLFNFGSTVPPGSNGDVDGSGFVDLADLSMVLFAFGTVC